MLLRIVALAFLAAALVTPAVASDTSLNSATQSGLIYDMKLGALMHDAVPVTGHSTEPLSADLNVEVMFGPSLPVLFGTVRPAVGATINFAGYTSKAYVDARWQVECCWGSFFALGIGAAIHDGHIDDFGKNWRSQTVSVLMSDIETAGHHKQLGSRVLFHPTIEWGYRIDDHNSLSIFAEHISNANLARKNDGLDNQGIRYGYRF